MATRYQLFKVAMDFPINPPRFVYEGRFYDSQSIAYVCLLFGVCEMHSKGRQEVRKYEK